MFKKNKSWLVTLILGIVAVLGGGAYVHQSQQPSPFHPAQSSYQQYHKKGHVDHRIKWGTSNGSQYQTPDEDLSSSVLTPSVKKQLGNIAIDGKSGSFIINNNKSTLNADVASAPWARNDVDSLNRPTMGDALLNKTTRQYKNRSETNNGASNWKPQGFVQKSDLVGYYKHAYDRGHLLGYALIGGLHGFNASESNPRNIATQTAWANEAGSADSKGQNYYEGIVRKALDQGKTVRYRVQDIYDGNDLVPSGAHIQAKSTDGSIAFNVFVPNVQNGLRINYLNGVPTVLPAK